jgi:putative mycofactocin binding protein MftB
VDPVRGPVRLDQPWDLSPLVALRPEPFGALAYHYGNRRLTFVKRAELVDVLRRLRSCSDVAEALSTAGIPGGHWPSYRQALDSLAAADMIHPRTEVEEPL